jgi:hypothetical protein
MHSKNPQLVRASVIAVNYCRRVWRPVRSSTGDRHCEWNRSWHLPFAGDLRYHRDDLAGRHPQTGIQGIGYRRGVDIRTCLLLFLVIIIGEIGMKDY